MSALLFSSWLVEEHWKKKIKIETKEEKKMDKSKAKKINLTWIDTMATIYLKGVMVGKKLCAYS